MIQYKVLKRVQMKNMLMQPDNDEDRNIQDVEQMLNVLGKDNWRPAGLQLGNYEVFWRELGDTPDAPGKS